MNKVKNQILRHLFVLATMTFMGMTLSSCFDDPESTYDKYKDWREQNDKYIADAEALLNNDGTAYYSKIVPSWAPETFVLLHWHNNRELTKDNLMPMDNSTTQITYELFDIEGNAISNSFSQPDSVYTSKPFQNIIGMWAALTNMNVGDSVTMVIPSQAGYGESTSRSEIKPYSTLIYNVKLKAVTAYEIP